jgi:oligopeptide transport system substrate-binding protein
MARISFHQFRSATVAALLASFLIGCTSSANSRFWGKTVAPNDNILRYISGSEPESLDPAFGTGQPEARVYMALYEGLVEYHPKTMEPIPAIAERWELSPDGTEYTFYLRKNAKFSNGDPITAKDFVYTFRRSLSPEVASRNANLGYYIKYSEAYNSGNMFVKDGSGEFLLAKDFVKETEKKTAADTPENSPEVKDEIISSAPFSVTVKTKHQILMDSPERLIVKGSERDRAKQLEADPKLKAAVDGKELDLQTTPLCKQNGWSRDIQKQAAYLSIPHTAADTTVDLRF